MVTITRELSTSSMSHHQHASTHRPIRADTLDLKQKLAVALGPNGTRYWQTLVQFCKGAIDRSEFESLAHNSLKSEHVHLHNALILGILYNASADVPGPSSRASRRVTRILPDGTQVTEEEEEEPSRKRLRTLVAGLPRRERLRLSSLEKAGKMGLNHTSGAASLGWAGAAADMLEKKRKDEEKRKVAEDRRKVRQYKSAIGARDWKGQAIQATQQVGAVKGKLSFSSQQAIARALQAPLCVESKHLPDLETLKDRMTLLAVETGMPGGIQPQAAAMVLCALQSHLQNVAGSIISKVRANRPNGIRTAEPQRPASTFLNMDASSYLPASLQTMSPKVVPMDVDDSVPESAQSSPRRDRHAVPSVQSDVSSSRTSTSGIGTSLGDASVLSLASTAATSLAGHSSPSTKDGDSSSQLQDSSFTEGDDAANSSNSSIKLKRLRDETVEHDVAPSRLTLSDLAFMLEIAPTTVIEPMGQGTQERLLAPEWDDDEDDNALLSQHPDRQLARAAKQAATAKMCDTTAGDNNSVRNRFVIDQSAPLRLLDRRGLLAENDGRGARPTKGGLTVTTDSLGSKIKDSGNELASAGVLNDVNGRTTTKKDGSASHHHHHRTSRDEIWDVVDPVALLGRMFD